MVFTAKLNIFLDFVKKVRNFVVYFMEKTRLIELPKILDERGNLTFIEECHHIPFVIGGVTWIYDVPGGQWREGYCLPDNDEFIVPLSGSFEVEFENDRVYAMNLANVGLYVPAGIRHRLINFSTNSIALILCSGTVDSEVFDNEHD